MELLTLLGSLAEALPKTVGPAATAQSRQGRMEGSFQQALAGAMDREPGRPSRLGSAAETSGAKAELDAPAASQPADEDASQDGVNLDDALVEEELGEDAAVAVKTEATWTLALPVAEPAAAALVPPQPVLGPQLPSAPESGPGEGDDDGKSSSRILPTSRRAERSVSAGESLAPLGEDGAQPQAGESLSTRVASSAPAAATPLETAATRTTDPSALPAALALGARTSGSRLPASGLEAEPEAEPGAEAAGGVEAPMAAERSVLREAPRAAGPAGDPGPVRAKSEARPEPRPDGVQLQTAEATRPRSEAPGALAGPDAQGPDSDETPETSQKVETAPAVRGADETVTTRSAEPLPTSAIKVQAGEAKAPPLESSQPSLKAIELPERAVRILHTMRREGQDSYRAELRLDPPALGKLRIEFQLEGDKSWTRLTVENRAAQEHLQAELPRIRELLQQQGLGEAQVEVQLRQGGGQDAREQSQQGSTPRQQRDTIIDAAPMRVLRSAHDGLIDLRA